MSDTPKTKAVKRLSVTSKEYRDGYARIFGPKAKKPLTDKKG